MNFSLLEEENSLSATDSGDGSAYCLQICLMCIFGH